MKHAGQSLRRNTLAAILQGVGTALLLFILFRFLNQEVGASKFGVWSVVVATASSSRIGNLGLSKAATRYVARHLALGDPDRARETVETAVLTLALVLAIFLGILYIPLEIALHSIFTHTVARQLALELLPFALFSLWLSEVATAYQSALDGCQRIDLRAIGVLAGQSTLLIAAFFLVPRFGIRGAVFSQIGQGMLSLLISWLLLRGQLNGVRLARLRWRKHAFKEMAFYGFNLQVSGLLALFLDPVAKGLMAHFGGAAQAGYFEMASQVVQKLRNVIVLANQAIVPKVAEFAETKPANINKIYRNNQRLLVALTVPTFAALFVTAPLISLLLTGNLNADLITFLEITTLGYFFNIFAAPGYFINLGTGHLALNVISHAVMALGNLAAAWLLGWLFGSLGVAIGYILGIVTGSSVMLLGAHRRYYGKHMAWPTPRQRWGLTIAALSVTVGTWNSQATMHDGLPRIVATASILLALCIISFYLNPDGTKLIADHLRPNNAT